MAVIRLDPGREARRPARGVRRFRTGAAGGRRFVPGLRRHGTGAACERRLIRCRPPGTETPAR